MADFIRRRPLKRRRLHPSNRRPEIHRTDDGNPHLEAVFAVLAGWLILGEVMTGKEIVGCVLVFVAVILAQIPLPARLFGK